MKASTFCRLRASAAKSPITPVPQVSTSFAGALIVLTAALLVAGTSIQSASAQTVTYAGSGAVNFGSPNVCPPGKTTPAPCSQTLTLTYNVTGSGTLGTPLALTTGVPDLDYKVGGGSTCSGSVLKGNTCKVNVTFAPTAPGARNGAVEIVDASGNILATTYIYGSGVGPLPSFSPPASLELDLGPPGTMIYPLEIAADAGGNLFYSDFWSGELREIMAVNGRIPANPVIKDLGIYSISDFAIDGAGNIFYTDFELATPSIAEILAAGGYRTSRIISSVDALSIAVDGSGNVFMIVDSTVQEILADGGYTTTRTLGGGFRFYSPYSSPSMALDSGGNVFVTDPVVPDGDFTGAVFELSAADGFATARIIHVSNAQDSYPGSIAIDPAENIFIVFADQYPLGEALATGGVVSSNPAILLHDLGSILVSQIALDPGGNGFLIASNGMGYGIEEVQFSTPPPVYFPPTFVGQTSSQSLQIQNEGNASLDLASLSVTSNWSLVPGSGSPEDCASGLTLAPSSLCGLDLRFEPAAVGSLTGAVDLVDNSLNASGSAQAIPLSGVGLPTTTPYITGLNDNYGAPYSVVILSGVNFGKSQGASTVTFNGIPTPHYAWADTKVYVTVPPTAATGSIIATVNGHASNPFPFTVLPMPVITGISPTTAPENSTVTISGRNLADYENKGVVTFVCAYFGEVMSLPATILSQTSSAITVQAPDAYASQNCSGYFHVVVNDTGMNTPGFNLTD